MAYSMWIILSSDVSTHLSRKFKSHTPIQVEATQRRTVYHITLPVDSQYIAESQVVAASVDCEFYIVHSQKIGLVMKSTKRERPRLRAVT